MTIKIALESADEMFRRHADLGWQCPECYGVRIETFQSDKYPGAFKSWQCQECGCQWLPPLDEESR